MFGINQWQKIAKALIASLITGILVLSMVSCSGASGEDRAATQTVPDSGNSSQRVAKDISEVSPPQVIQELRQALEVYQPQVAIASPQADEVLQDNTVTVKLQVQDLPIFVDPDLGMGSHLKVILDNQPYTMVYDLTQPLVFPDLEPGTHTVRVLASRPWHESFKNEGAYAQTTFHIFTKTQDNNPDSSLPLLTYSSPTGSYGAEPILLDFYLTNAPLHIVAQENSKDEIADWRIRCIVNGNTFVLDSWQPLYLKGFKPGKNWVQLEFLDEQGNPVKNVFNNTVRLIAYEPKGKDTLSKIVRGELTAPEVRGIVDPNYKTKPPSSNLPTPSSVPPSETTPAPPPSEDKQAEPEIESKEQDEPQPNESKQLEKPKNRNLFDRFRRRATTPSPTLPEIMESPAPQPIPPDVTAPELETIPEPQPLETPQPETKESKQASDQAIIDRFRLRRRPTVTPSPSLPPTLPEIIDATPPELVVPTASNSSMPTPGSSK